MYNREPMISFFSLLKNTQNTFFFDHLKSQYESGVKALISFKKSNLDIYELLKKPIKKKQFYTL
jgi:hypothetical protein